MDDGLNALWTKLFLFSKTEYERDGSRDRPAASTACVAWQRWPSL